ncbi:hypothetical protein PVL29_016282 [Vitis rotundifolia]|uniref:RRM domain-containing protein n=1 Tax=Vitis rotundifolia TaxID=103349 RepID=A0AA38ZG12_VITRO|nr:hypothetical protein PVL29_016282 [Vitis rotundifolia]
MAEASDSEMGSPENEALISAAQNPSSSDSDSDSDVGEAEELLRLQTLESEVSSDPSKYDAHVEYIKCLRKLGEIEKLREAREAMSALHPLTPLMWQEWARDELTARPEAFLEIEKLYEKGVFDYLSVPLWCDYLNFVQEHDPAVRECSSEGILKARNLFERALTAAGLHVAEGSKIWEVYREFEQAILLTIDENDNEAKEKQVQRIRNIFHRQLSVPLANMRSTLLAFKAWEVEQGNVLDVNSSSMDGISSHVASAYQKAMDMYDARAHLEEQIVRQDISDSERHQQFLNYLNFEQSSGDPARVQILYERAVTEFPVSRDLWLDYTHYLDKTLKVANVVRDVYSRAVKNCPWVGELWVQYLLSLERAHASERDISTVFDKSLQCTFSRFEEYLDLFLTRVDGLRRRISLPGQEEVLDYALIRDAFQYASDYLSPHLKCTDDLVRLHAYWARLELNLNKDLVAARGVWESLLKNSGSMFGAWQGYIAMELEAGHINEARSIYKRCYSKRFAGTGSEDICHSWLRFEREFGTLEDLEHAVRKVTPRLAELQLFKLQESKSTAASTDQIENPHKKNAREKRKSSSSRTDEQPPAKRQKDTAQNPKKVDGKGRIELENIVASNEEQELKAKDDKPDDMNKRQMKGPSHEKNKYLDQCTAFISNLDLEANYEHVRDFFSDVGGVTAIRILKDKFTGKSRGLAYVDFSDDAHLAAAVAKNKKMMRGKKLSIARSDPKQKGKGAGHSNDQTGTVGESDSKESGQISSSKAPQARRDDNFQLKGRNTFAVPRNVRPLGWIDKKKKTEEETDEMPKSNDEFRKMLLKS